MLTDTGRNRMTGASVALRVLAEARQDGLTDAEVLERSPVVLALTPPRVGPRPELPADATPMHLGRRRGERQRQRHPPRGAPAPRAVGAGAHRSCRLGARRATHRVRRHRRARHDPPHDPRARRGGLHPPGRGRPVARPDAPPQLRRPAPRPVPDLGPGQGHPRAARPRGGRRNRRRRRGRAGSGHLRRAGSADRVRARHHHALARARSAPHAAERHRRRDRLGPLPPGDPLPRGRRPDRRRLRQRHPGSAGGRRGHRRRRHRTRHRRGRGGRPNEDHRVARRHRHPARRARCT